MITHFKYIKLSGDDFEKVDNVIEIVIDPISQLENKSSMVEIIMPIIIRKQNKENANPDLKKLGVKVVWCLIAFYISLALFFFDVAS